MLVLYVVILFMLTLLQSVSYRPPLLLTGSLPRATSMSQPTVPTMVPSSTPSQHLVSTSTLRSLRKLHPPSSCWPKSSAESIQSTKRTPLLENQVSLEVQVHRELKYSAKNYFPAALSEPLVFCSSSFPLTSTRWIWSRLLSLCCPLLSAAQAVVPSINFGNINN